MSLPPEEADVEGVKMRCGSRKEDGWPQGAREMKSGIFCSGKICFMVGMRLKLFFEGLLVASQGN